jgi:DNA replication and repair protein RecF
VAAHFDPRRRLALFEALGRIGGQVFVTGADPNAFAGLDARLYEVTPGKVTAVK